MEERLEVSSISLCFSSLFLWLISRAVYAAGFLVFSFSVIFGISLIRLPERVGVFRGFTFRPLSTKIKMTLQDHLPTSSARVDALMADFKGLDKLDDIVTKVLERLVAKDSTQRQAQTVRQGGMSVQEFDGWFSELIRVELGKTLGVIRNKAIQKAAAAGAGSAATAVYRRMYKNGLGGNVNICGNRGRISSRRRIDMRPVGGKSGIIRERSIRRRTQDINEYYGPDRHFILRFLNEGTDVRVATPEGPTGRGSRATYGNRSNITAKGFFNTMRTDMEQAAQQLGETLVGRVEKWADQQFTDIDNAS